MRPVKKLPVGHTVTLDDDSTHTIAQHYSPYRNAKHPLRANLDDYCSYCEVARVYCCDEAIEHILPKSIFPRLETDWDNFLLACPICNSHKSAKVCHPSVCHYPHLNNTFKSFKYDAGGVVIVNPHLTGLSFQKAQALLNLVGLNKGPGTSSPNDNRWQRRSFAWDKAVRYRSKYQLGIIDADAIIDYIKVTGFWSIWFTVFEGIDVIRRRLIYEFAGTAIDCFDPNNNYAPVDRNPGNIDPV